MSRKVNQSRVGGMWRGGGGEGRVWKGQGFSQRKTATLNLFDASPQWFQSHRRHNGVYQEGRLIWRCLLRPTRSCLTCERSVLPALCQRQRQERGLMRVRTVIALMHPKSDEICRRHTHTVANRTPGRLLATQHLIPDIKACDCPRYSPAQLCVHFQWTHLNYFTGHLLPHRFPFRILKTAKVKMLQPPLPPHDPGEAL